MTHFGKGSESGWPSPGTLGLWRLVATALLALPAIVCAKDQTVAKLVQGNVVLTDGRCDNVTFLAYMDLPAGARLTGCWFNFAGAVNIRWMGTGESNNFPMTSFIPEEAFRERWELRIAEARSSEPIRISRDPQTFATYYGLEPGSVMLYDDMADFDHRVNCRASELAATYNYSTGLGDWGCWHLDGAFVVVQFQGDMGLQSIPISAFRVGGSEWESERYRNPMIAAFHPRNFESARADAGAAPPVAAPPVPQRRTPELGRRIAFVHNDEAGEISLHEGRATGLCSEGYRMASSSGGAALEPSRGCWKVSFGIVRVALSVPGQMTVEIPE